MKQLLTAILLLSVLMPLYVVAHDNGYEKVTVKMTEAGFEPSVVNIMQGDTVIFVNESGVDRWPASNIHPTHAIYSEFDPKRAVPFGEVWEFRFTKAGTWKLHDHLMTEFTGSIVVAKVSDFVDEEEIIDKESIVRKTISAIKLRFAKWFYTLLPSKLEEKTANVSFLKITKNDDSLTYWVSLVGSKVVMEKIIQESGGGSELDCHTEAHQVGRKAYDLFGASSYDDGSAACHSGFYHGAMEAFISSVGTDNLNTEIVNLCESFSTHFGTFECYHGIGHGLMAYEDYDLPVALSDCRTLRSSFEQRSCFGGVFMENIIAGQGNAAIEGHSTDWVSDDPHFPCNGIENVTSAVEDCYMMQTSWMLKLYKYNFAEVAEECMRADPAYISICYQSYGRDSAGHYLRDPEKIIKSCSYVPNEKDYYKRCVLGGVYVILDFWGPGLKNQADKFCDLLEGETQNSCRSVVSSRKADLAGTP